MIILARHSRSRKDSRRVSWRPRARIVFHDSFLLGPTTSSSRALSLEEGAGSALLATDDEGGPGGLFKDLADTLLGLGRALEVGDGADVVRHSLAFVGLERGLVHLLEFALGVFVVPQIFLVAHQDNRHVGAEMPHFRRPLLRNILQAVRRIDGEAHQNHVRVRIRQRSETIVVFLTSRVPQGELDLAAVNFDVSDVIFKDGGDVDFGELVLGEDDQETGFAAGAVTNDNQLSPPFSFVNQFFFFFFFFNSKFVRF